jgi:hypothetical protein
VHNNNDALTATATLCNTLHTERLQHCNLQHCTVHRRTALHDTAAPLHGTARHCAPPALPSSQNLVRAVLEVDEVALPPEKLHSLIEALPTEVEAKRLRATRLKKMERFCEAEEVMAQLCVVPRLAEKVP